MGNGYDRYLDKQFGMGGGFFRLLFDTIAKADGDNLAKLEKGFPEEVDAYKTWTRVGKDAFLAKCSPDNPILEKVASGGWVL